MSVLNFTSLLSLCVIWFRLCGKVCKCLKSTLSVHSPPLFAHTHARTHAHMDAHTHHYRHPERSKRPSFSEVYSSLMECEDSLLQPSSFDHSQLGSDELTESAGMYTDLQQQYNSTLATP